LAIAIRTTDIRHEHRAAAVSAPRVAYVPRTECLTPLAIAAGVVLWTLIIALVRAFI
jgi:hypothetical protein